MQYSGFSDNLASDFNSLAVQQDPCHTRLLVIGMMDKNSSHRSSTEVFHASVFYSGRVQGVGFRYQVLQVAKQFEVSGFVRNLSDGRVQLEAEGREPEVKAFVEEVRDQLSVFIRQVESGSGRREPRFKGFIIAR